MKGFSLVELLVVLAIVVLAGAAIIPAFLHSGNSNEAKMRRASIELRSTLLAARSYAITNRTLAGVFYYRRADGRGGYVLAAPNPIEKRTVVIRTGPEEHDYQTETWGLWDLLPGNSGRFRPLPDDFEITLENYVGARRLALTHTPNLGHSVVLASPRFIEEFRALGVSGNVYGHVFGPNGSLGGEIIPSLKQSLSLDAPPAHRKLKIISTTGRVKIEARGD